jgi:hypothetical protein
MGKTKKPEKITEKTNELPTAKDSLHQIRKPYQKKLPWTKDHGVLLYQT